MEAARLNIFFVIKRIQIEFLQECRRRPAQFSEPAYYVPMYGTWLVPKLIRIDPISACLFRRRFKAYWFGGEVIVEAY